MVKKMLSVITVLLLTSMTVFSQNIDIKAVDYKKIKKEISKENSAYYYPVLLGKYLNSDTNMTLEEKRHLYYGYPFQKRYSPYGSSAFSDSIRLVAQKNDLEENDLRKLIRYADSVLVDNPFDLRAMNYQLYAFEKLGEKEKFDKKINQMRIVVDAILSSGDGLSKETAFYVIYVSHEYDLLNILGFKFGGVQKLIDHYDYLKLKRNPQKIKGFYFDITPSLNYLSKEFNKSRNN